MSRSPYVVGRWVSDSVFVADEEQPGPEHKSFASVARWVHERYEDTPGEYSIIRKPTGTVLVGKQLQLNLGV